MLSIISRLVLLTLLASTLSYGTDILGQRSLGVGYDIFSGRQRLPVIGLTNQEGQSVFNPFSGASESCADQVFVHFYDKAEYKVGVYTALAEYVAAKVEAVGINGAAWDSVNNSIFAGSEEVAQAGAVLAGAEFLLAVAKFEISLYSAELYNDSTSLTLHKYFQKAVESLPEQYDEQAYSNFIQSYGTHYVSYVVLGGRLSYEAAISANFSAAYGEVDIASYSLAQLANSTGDVGALYSEAAAGVAAEVAVYGKLKWEGGVVGQVNATEWSSSVGRIPTPIALRITSLSHLLRNSNKQQSFNKASTHYLSSQYKSLLLSRSKV